MITALIVFHMHTHLLINTDCLLLRWCEVALRKLTQMDIVSRRHFTACQDVMLLSVTECMYSESIKLSFYIKCAFYLITDLSIQFTTILFV